MQKQGEKLLIKKSFIHSFALLRFNVSDTCKHDAIILVFDPI